MRIHFIAIGGSAMHNLALALHENGHHVSGSDDEIYEPSRSRLEKAGLLPSEMGWSTDRISTDIDAIVLGMHARVDNPELIRAQELGLRIYSYPEYVARQAEDKKRIVIAGSHGKTTTTSIIMHVLRLQDMDFDYLVGAQIKGYDRMVRLSDAPLIILEGDEYLSSPIDRSPKMLHYKPHLAVLTGVAWDHINVFPTEADYNRQFELFVDTIEDGGALYYYADDQVLEDIVGRTRESISCVGYHGLDVKDGQFSYDGSVYPIQLFGEHNYQNIHASYHICSELGVSGSAFFKALATFTGAARRLELMHEKDGDRGLVYLDFAHAPSKVKATVQALVSSTDRPVHAVFELHTFSSLNKDFLPTYRHTMNPAHKAAVYYDAHTIEMKRMPPLDPSFVKESFGREDLVVLTDKKSLEAYVSSIDRTTHDVLMMSSGKFGGIDVKSLLA